jgi:hypothetical protein
MPGFAHSVCQSNICPDPTDLWLDLSDLLSGDAVAAAHVRRALHVDSFDPAAVRRFCMPWLLDPFCFLSACPRSVSVAVCSVLACYVLLVGASVADAAVPAGERVFAAGVVHSCLHPLLLPPTSRVARPPSATSGVPRPKPLWGKAWSPIYFFFLNICFFRGLACAEDHLFPPLPFTRDWSRRSGAPLVSLGLCWLLYAV